MSLYLPEFTISGIFSDLVDHDDYVAWSNKANSQWQADDEVNHPPRTPVDFIREFNISKETFTQANFTIPEYAPFTQEEIDIIYSFDLTRINAHFGNPDAVILGENIYPFGLVRKEPGRGMGRPRYSGTDGRGGFPEIIAHSFGRDQKPSPGQDRRLQGDVKKEPPHRGLFLYGSPSS